MPKVITSNATSSGGDIEYVQVNADWNATDGVSAILNKPNIPSEMTATEVLTKLKTVDGTGSGLDADKLDGNEASAFALSGHSHPNDHAPITVSDTASIDLTLVGQALSASAKFGTTSGTVAQGDDSRFTDARNPLAHNHDDMYFTETEINGFLAGKANASHSHLIADLPPYPTTLPADGGTADTLTGLVPTVTELNFVDGVTSAIQGQIDLKSPSESPSFTGTPLAPTPLAGTNNTQIATTEFVQNSMANAGSGDMLKSVYDTDGDGKVDNSVNSDNADTLDGKHAIDFSDKIHTHTSDSITRISDNSINSDVSISDWQFGAIVMGASASGLGYPISQYGSLLSVRGRSDYGFQLYGTRSGGNNLFMRNSIGTSWGSWQKLIDDNSVIDGGTF